MGKNLFILIARKGHDLIKKSAESPAKFLLSLRITPNYITILRIILTPFLAGLIYSKLAWRFEVLFWISLCLIYSDALDGAMARLGNSESKTGAVLDPLADKLFVGVMALTLLEKMPSLSITIIFLQVISGIFALISLNIASLSLDKIKADLTGKTKMFFYSAGIVVMLFSFAYWEKLLFLVKCLFIVGIPLDCLSIYRKIKNIYYVL